jgi:hypothetical protein
MSKVDPQLADDLHNLSAKLNHPNSDILWEVVKKTTLNIQEKQVIEYVMNKANGGPQISLHPANTGGEEETKTDADCSQSMQNAPIFDSENAWNMRIYSADDFIKWDKQTLTEQKKLTHKIYEIIKYQKDVKRSPPPAPLPAPPQSKHFFNNKKAINQRNSAELVSLGMQDPTPMHASKCHSICVQTIATYGENVIIAYSFKNKCLQLPIETKLFFNLCPVKKIFERVFQSLFSLFGKFKIEITNNLTDFTVTSKLSDHFKLIVSENSIKLEENDENDIKVWLDMSFESEWAVFWRSLDGDARIKIQNFFNSQDDFNVDLSCEGENECVIYTGINLKMNFYKS